jgi:hypothetical protein
VIESEKNCKRESMATKVFDAEQTKALAGSHQRFLKLLSDLLSADLLNNSATTFARRGQTRRPIRSRTETWR